MPLFTTCSVLVYEEVVRFGAYTPTWTHLELSQMDVGQFFDLLMLKTQSLILIDRHNMVNNNGIVFNDNAVHQ
jgi:hypothetical protein